MGGGLAAQSAHEFGHLLGDTESGNPDSLMDSGLGQLTRSGTVHATQADLQNTFGFSESVRNATEYVNAPQQSTVYAPNTIETKINNLWLILTHKY